MLRNLSSWILTDGKAGDEQQCLGLAEALELEPAMRTVRPRAPYAWLMPWGPIDPAERPSTPGSPLAPPFPDLAIASGRRAVPYLRHLKKASGGRTFTVFLKDPRTGAGAADLIWVAEHDRLRAENVVVTLTPPHRISARRLEAARSGPDPRLCALPHPRIAVLAGGDSRHHRFTDADIDRFLAHLRQLADEGAALMITASRRTPERMREALKDLAERRGGFFWNGEGANPYIDLLALADAIVGTADSSNMLGEAAATGTPILIFEPAGGHPKFRAFLDGLKRHGAVHALNGGLERTRYEPLNSTPTIAKAVAEGLARHRRALGLEPFGHERSAPAPETP